MINMMIDKGVINSHYIYSALKYPIIGLGMVGLSYYASGTLNSNSLLVDLVSKFDRSSGYEIATLKHYILAREYLKLSYESVSLDYFGKFLSNGGLTLGYSMASIYSESLDFISGLMPEDMPVINDYL